MEKMVDIGKARMIGETAKSYLDRTKFLMIKIGLSNFNIVKIKRVLKTARIRPSVNQIELHP